MVACDFGVSFSDVTVCAEVAVASPPDGDRCGDRTWFPWAYRTAGRPVPACPRSGNQVSCHLGDTTLFTTLGDREGDDLAAVTRDVRRDCYSAGGVFGSGGIRGEVPPRRPPVRLDLPAISATTKASPDCVADTNGVSCGGDSRPVVVLNLLLADLEGVGLPADADAALASIRASVGRTGVVTELRRQVDPDGAWTLEVVASAAHGPSALQFHEVRRVGERRLHCSGSAWGQADLAEALAICRAVTLTTP